MPSRCRADVGASTRFTAERWVTAGDTVVDHLRGEGTHLGELRDPSGTLAIPATGKRARWKQIRVLRLAGGRIVEAKSTENTLGLARQLGARIAPIGP